MPRATFRLKITDDESLEKINIDNIKLKDRFLKEKNTRSSDGTIKNYESDLNIFFVWNLKNNSNKFFVDIRKIEFAEFFSFCTDELKWNSARFSRMRSCLSSLSNFIEKFYDDEYPQFRNVILKSIESMPKIAAREKTILSENQVDGLLKYLVDNNYFQEACWLALAISSGARFSELLRFSIDIIDENNLAFNDIFLETLRKIKTKGRTKNGKMLIKYIIKDIFIPYYQLWLPEREKILRANNQNHNFIFIDKDGFPAEEHIVRSWLKKFENYLGLSFYPHCLRHYTTTYLSKIGIPHTLIKEIFGWESIEMVSIYDDIEAKDKEWVELDKLKEHLNK